MSSVRKTETIPLVEISEIEAVSFLDSLIVYSGKLKDPLEILGE